MTTPLETARWFEERSVRVLGYARGQKNPGSSNWQKTSIADIESAFANPDQNIGILLGDPSNGLIDVDLDHPKAIELAEKYLPPTACRFGRKSKRESHWLYFTSPSNPTKQYRFPSTVDANGKKITGPMICESRATGAQTVAPGSSHPSGELIEWYSHGEPAIVDAQTLADAVRNLAEACGAAVKPPTPVFKGDRKTANRTFADSGAVKRCQKYLQKMQDAIDGHGGHDATFAAACVIRKFGLSEGDAWGLMNWFNEAKCSPPWNEKELRHKLTESLEVVTKDGEFGSMLRTNSDIGVNGFSHSAARGEAVQLDAGPGAGDIKGKQNSAEPKPQTLGAVATNDFKQPAPVRKITETDYKKSAPVIVRMSDVKAEKIEYLSPSMRIPVGKLVVFAGVPGEGKSVCMMEFAANTSVGLTWPDRMPLLGGAGDVVLLLAEDGLADTVKPRLVEAGCDPTRITAITAVKHRIEGVEETKSFCLATDMAALEAAIGPNTKLIIIDTINSYIGGKANSDKDSEIRQILLPLTELAERTGVSIVAVSHLNKSGTGRAIGRIMGSLAFVGVARVVWMLTTDEADKERRILAPIKCNVGKMPQARAFRIEDGPKLVWEADGLDLTADDMLRRHEDVKEDRKADGAKDWLMEALKNGPVLASTMIDDSQARGITRFASDKACVALGVVKGRPGTFGGSYYWAMPPFVNAGKVSLSAVVAGQSSSVVNTPNTDKDHQIREITHTEQQIGKRRSPAVVAVVAGCHSQGVLPTTTGAGHVPGQLVEYVGDEV